MKNIKDIQSQPDFRKIAIDKVGVKDISYPIVVLDKKNKFQHTIASVNMYVDLPHHFKGTHMSRFIEILNEHRGEITVKNFPDILAKMKKRFNAQTAHMEVGFPYFIEKAAPVSKAKGLMEYRCRFTGSLGDKKDFVLEITVPVTTLCPCSKEISRKGAHNQRGIVKVNLRFKGFIWIEDIIKIVEASASSQVYSLLKRPDERYVTEHAYDNPRFVEDVVREVASKLEALKGIIWFSIEAENLESIHNHSAYAYLEKT
ncbi:MAG TPA: GTP cyclohydrolase FolE2 [Thermodesulfobacteriota bacterium]|nr:GTP cyclohydrolase FolE2 [Deltaproteobacteria bacterium]HKZ47110.1 GTP cyclohydrolase FolE2 [Thermodesulfobacteriota bacterium]HLA51224.1 GTP cyclohydrolase FolE2 [Thermodesulfobacteriota bacterium]